MANLHLICVDANKVSINARHGKYRVVEEIVELKEFLESKNSNRKNGRVNT
jgi:hypothetical protein